MELRHLLPSESVTQGMAGIFPHGVQRPIDVVRKESRDEWFGAVKGAWRAMSNTYDRSSSMTKQFVFAVCVSVTTAVILGLGAMTLSHGSRLDKLEQHQIDTDAANAANVRDIKDSLNYIRGKVDGGGRGIGQP